MCKCIGTLAAPFFMGGTLYFLDRFKIGIASSALVEEWKLK